MKFEELFEYIDKNDTHQGFYDPKDDQAGQRHIDDTHKPKLTLRRLNKLRHIRAARTVENIKRRKLFGVIYGQPKEGGGGGSPFG
jgi:hypothetical protein